tara:strand:+ start:358 stop:666 length:309 start_codon:yes stop_codon:yes gene_type:complete
LINGDKMKKSKRQIAISKTFFQEDLNKIYKLFEDSNEEVTVIYVDEPDKTNHLDIVNTRISTVEEIENGHISREYILLNNIIDKDNLDLVFMLKNNYSTEDK